MTKTHLLPLCCAALLSACTGVPQTQIKVIKPDIPVSLRTCDDGPAYPGDDITQRDVAENYTNLWYAHKDCKSKLSAVNRALQQPAENK
jgi:hypothetical protein